MSLVPERDDALVDGSSALAPAASRPLVSWLAAVNYVDKLVRPDQQRFARDYLAHLVSAGEKPVPLFSGYRVSFAASEIIRHTIEYLLAQPAPVLRRRPRRRRPQ